MQVRIPQSSGTLIGKGKLSGGGEDTREPAAFLPMTFPPTVSVVADSTLDEQAMLYALGELSGEEKAQFETCLHCEHSSASRLVREYQDLLAVVATMGQAELAPDPVVKERVLQCIHRSAPSQPTSGSLLPVQLIWGEEQPWRPTPYPGVRLKEVSMASGEFAVLMLELEPGGVVPEHHHRGSEDLYLLSGDLQVEGESRLMRAGDFMHCQTGSRHRAMISPSGCRALTITSRKNYSPAAVRAYGVAHRVVTQVKGWWGSKPAATPK